MKRFILTLASLITLSPHVAFAFGNDEAWQSGFGQGVCESTITKGAGNRIYVAEDCGSGRGASISFQIGGKDIESGDLLFVFDDSDPFTVSMNGAPPMKDDCSVCEANFTHMLKNFCTHKTVLIRTAAGSQTRFSLKGASDAIQGCEK